MKIKNKGKVHPSPSSSSSSSSNDREVVLSVLKLLPAAILALASVLSLEDREVLAYLITKSLKTPSSSSSSSSSSSESKKKSSKKALNSTNNGGGGGSAHSHRPPMFDCDCFDCYTSYWVRWDSSPNRELIHQVIEAFEDHLTNGEKSSSKKINGRGKRKDKLGRSREAHNVVLAPADGPAQPDSPLPESSTTTTTAAATDTASSETTSFGCETAVVSVPEVEKITDGLERNEVEENDVVEATKEEELLSEAADDDVAVVLRTMAASDHKGLARKVLPDVLGLLNSRLWSLWSPNA